MTNFVFDLETNALELEDVDRITMFVYAFKKEGEWQTRSTTNYDEMRKFFNYKSIKAGHNILRYDLPVAKKILGIEYDYREYVDTLGTSWTLYPKRIEHGIGAWGKEFGVEKPHIENFENVSEEEIRHRCTEDVVINCKLVDKIEADLNNLYGNTHWHVYLRYLGFKLHNISLQREKPLKVDLVKLQSNLDELETNKNERLEELKPFLDPVPIYSVKKKPKVLYKKDGSLSVAGENWKGITDKYGVDIETKQEFKEIVGYKEPSAGSPSQIKNWLFSIGWKPKTFKEGRNEPVPQIKDGDELCESVLELAKQHPEVQLLDKIGILTHRIGLLKGFLENHKGGYIYQDIAGFTSTLRMRHKYLVNLPKPMMEFGQAARGVLTCDEGWVLCGSDLASLEDRIKQHLIFHLDPDYVKEMMSPDFDPHISLAVFAKALTQDDADFYKSFKKQKKNPDFKYSKEEAERFDKIDKIRHIYKTANYSLQFGVGIEKLSASTGLNKKQTQQLRDAYKRLNWSIEKVAESFDVKSFNGLSWVKNPINNFWYELRSEKDRFSAVVQGTGAFIFDLWVKEFHSQLPVSAQFHDEGLMIIKTGTEEQAKAILQKSIETVNKKLKLNREMGIDVQFGEYYSEVH